MTKKILFASFLVLSVYFLAAQDTILVQTATKSWAWNNYKIGFQAPTDLVVKENSAKVFYGGNEHIYLTIYPKPTDTLTHDNLPLALQKWAVGHKVSFSPSNSGYLSNNNRLWSYYISGSGYKGMATYVAVLVDPSHSEDSYYVWLQFQNGYAEAALNILNSFTLQ